MTLSFKMSIVVNKTLGLMLQRKPPNIGGHVLIINDYKDWYLNSPITKAVLSQLVSVKEGGEDADRIMKQIRLVEMT